MIRVPPTDAGSALQVISPMAGGIDGAPILVQAVATVSTNPIGSIAFYIISDVPLHFRTSFAGTAATVNDPWIPANTPMIFRCGATDKISVIRRGGSDGTVWVHQLESKG